MKIKIIFLVYILFCPLFIYSQKVEIVKDTVCLSGECFEIQELKIDNPIIYKKTQTAYNLLDSIFTNYEKRLNYKKKVIKDCKSLDELREIQYGFEDYEINFNKNNLLNLSISLQVYGSPYEYIKTFTFDIKKDKEIGDKLFRNKRRLFNLYLKKLREIEDSKIQVKYISLSQYQIVTDEKGDVSNLEFVFVNPDPAYHGARIYIIDFSFSEIKPFLNSKYLKYLKQ